MLHLSLSAKMFISLRSGVRQTTLLGCREKEKEGQGQAPVACMHMHSCASQPFRSFLLAPGLFLFLLPSAYTLSLSLFTPSGRVGAAFLNMYSYTVYRFIYSMDEKESEKILIGHVFARQMIQQTTYEIIMGSIHIYVSILCNSE